MRNSRPQKLQNTRINVAWEKLTFALPLCRIIMTQILITGPYNNFSTAAPRLSWSPRQILLRERDSSLICLSLTCYYWTLLYLLHTIKCLQRMQNCLFPRGVSRVLITTESSCLVNINKFISAMRWERYYLHFTGWEIKTKRLPRGQKVNR